MGFAQTGFGLSLLLTNGRNRALLGWGKEVTEKQREPFKSGVTDFEALNRRIKELGIKPVIGESVEAPAQPANPVAEDYYGCGLVEARNQAEYKCCGGHDLCSTVLPSPDCPYCEPQ